MKTWMKLSEVCTYLGLSKESLYRWTKTGKIPHHRVGKTILFDRDEIDQWVKSSQVKIESLRFLDLETGEVWFHKKTDWILLYCNFNSEKHPTQLAIGETMIATGADGRKIEIRCLFHET